MAQRLKYLGCVGGLILAATVAQDSARASVADVSSTEANVHAVQAWLRNYSASLNSGDLTAFGRLWVDDADWAPPDAPLVSGRQAILASARVTFQRYKIHHEFTSQAVKVVNDFAVALISSAERYRPTTAAGATWERRVKGVIVLRRTDEGSWAATYFIWNRDAPPAHEEARVDIPTPRG